MAKRSSKEREPEDDENDVAPEEIRNEPEDAPEDEPEDEPRVNNVVAPARPGVRVIKRGTMTVTG